MWAFGAAKVVERSVDTTCSTVAGIETPRKIKDIPELGGCSDTRAIQGTPECRPIPLNITALARVRWIDEYNDIV